MNAKQLPLKGLEYINIYNSLIICFANILLSEIYRYLKILVFVDVLCGFPVKICCKKSYFYFKNLRYF